jgi:hypothetical protein
VIADNANAGGCKPVVGLFRITLVCRGWSACGDALFYHHDFQRRGDKFGGRYTFAFDGSTFLSATCGDAAGPKWTELITIEAR